MGAFLASTPITVEGHRAASQRLIGLVGEQAAALRGRELLGVPVYAGGDDLLAFACGWRRRCGRRPRCTG